MGVMDLTVSIDEQLYRRVSELAKSSGVSTSQLVADVLARHVDIIAEIEEGVREADADEFATDEEVEAAFRRFGD